MTTLRFGSRPANMLDPAYFGFLGDVPGEDAAVDFGASVITLTDPDSGSIMRLYGSFDDSSEGALLGSPLTGFALYAGPDDLLFEWTQLPLTLGEYLFESDVVALAERLLGGDDTVLGGPADDVLFADFPAWYDALVLDTSLSAGERLALSADGRVMAGVAQRDLVIPGDPVYHARQEIYLIDPQTGERTLMSSGGGDDVADTHADSPSLTRDGGLLVFRSNDPAFGGQLGLGYDAVSQVVARDTATLETRIVSSNALGVAADGTSEAPVISADGSVVAFTSYAHNLVDGVDFAFNARQVFAKNLTTGTVEVVSTNAAGELGVGESFASAISGNGRYVFFASNATNLVEALPPEYGTNLFVKDLATGDIRFVATMGTGGYFYEADQIPLAISLDGRVVAFESWAPDLVPGDTNNGPDVFVKNLETGLVTRVSVDENGTEAAFGVAAASIALSGDGLVVAFETRSGELVSPARYYWGNVYVRDLTSGMIERLSDPNADNPWAPVALSADGQTIAFTQTVRTGPDYSGHDQLVVAAIDSASHDLIAGGGGNDFYFVERGADVVEQPGAGDDTVLTPLPAYVAPDNVEHVLYGGHGYFEATGNALDNTFSGGVLGDTFDGASGRDTLFLSGDRADYAVARDPDVDAAPGQAGRYFVTDTGPWGATDEATSIERLVFEDGRSAIGLDIDGTGGRAYRLYQAAFDRVPDEGGLGFWIHHLDRGFDFAAASANFMNSAEFIDLYGENPTNQEFIRLLYLNVQNREPDQGGYDFWTAALVGGVWNGIQLPVTSRAEVLLHFSDSPENYDNVIDAMSDGYMFQLWMG